MAPTDSADCKGVLVPEEFLKRALACRKVEVPKEEAKTRKCLRDFDIMTKTWENKESLYRDAIREERSRQELTSMIVTTSLAVLSGVLLGIMF